MPLNLAISFEKINFTNFKARIVKFKVNLSTKIVKFKINLSTKKPMQSDLSNILVQISRNQRDLAELLHLLAEQQHSLLTRLSIRDSQSSHNSSVLFSNDDIISDSLKLEMSPLFPLEASLANTPADSDVEMRLTKILWLQPPKVLLVDDDPIARKKAARILELLGCECAVAMDGIDAISQFHHKVFDVVLMDINMPNLDGLSATKHIRMFDLITPIISMTAYFSQEECINYLASGMNDIMAKPLTKNAFKAIVDKYCGFLKTKLHQDEFIGSFKKRKLALTQ